MPLCKEQTPSDWKAPTVKRSQGKHIFKALKKVGEVLNKHAWNSEELTPPPNQPNPETIGKKP